MSDSILQVNQIKDKGGNATGITVADSTANVTIGNLTATSLAGGNITSAVTGFTGIKTVDVWLLNKNLTGNQAPMAAQDFTRATSTNGGANLGTGMTLSGTGTDVAKFYFPSTGIWRVEVGSALTLNNSTRWIYLQIGVSTAGLSGSFTSLSLSRAFINRTDSDNTHTSLYATNILDVTTSGSSGSVVNFSITMANTSTTIHGGTTSLQTYFIFTRLGDT